ncbi:DNA-directed RNA polymerase subunit omega [Caldalkalibacillus mannanilyticus]|uniref:DNA-directed RNA polymerase subunit omega n=1 Tax=Caldalkalibacillus mannanilyticus TaxID=1418 RepID=UPI000468E3B0|nr:DNA-directed RNA polymerase subunit omega [Caldalkalibacillus mannanilyticus]
MLYPSIDTLLNRLGSKYTLVAVASKRARELRDHNNQYLHRTVSKKYVGVALEEIVEDYISFEKIIVEKE